MSTRSPGKTKPATPLEAVAPVYLKGLSPRSRYSEFRYHAGRKTREV